MGGCTVALRWFFYRDTIGHCRWEVHGAEGAIATSGKFEQIQDCVADARVQGFVGAAEPSVIAEPLPGSDRSAGVRSRGSAPGGGAVAQPKSAAR